MLALTAPGAMIPLPMLELTEAVSASSADAGEQDLLARIRALGSAVVAFSGGVDSSYVAWAARQALGTRALAVTGVSASLAGEARERALELARLIGIAHELVLTEELSDPRYLANGADRCYWCKQELYARLGRLARERGFAAVLDGSNRDDLGDFRPGRRAASEHGVLSPLVECGLGKAEVRWLSRRASLPTWHEPASPCLSSRVLHGLAIEPATLARIERAESAVRWLGFREFRVRHLELGARIEVAADELDRASEPAMTERLVAAVQAAGFASAVLDPRPFQSGRLNQPVDGRVPRST